MAKRFEKAKEYTEKYKNSMLPCGECQGTDIRINSERMIFAQKDAWSVSCSRPCCDCTGAYTSVKKAIKKWNEMQKGKVKEHVENQTRKAV